jgi:hypothetical protein
MDRTPLCVVTFRVFLAVLTPTIQRLATFSGLTSVVTSPVQMAYKFISFVEFAPTVRAETLLNIGIGSLSSCVLISLAVSIANNDIVASRVVMQL